MFLICCSYSYSQVVTISGYAPSYVGKAIEVYVIEDYFSNTQVRIATAKVKADSTFSLYVSSDISQKVVIKSLNNKGFLYIQPNSKYNILFPDKDKFDAYKPTGNNVEISFFDLDSTDINYKILGFQRWIDNFLGNNYHKKASNNTDFVESLDRFKTNVEKAYKEDTSTFFKTFVRFSIAGLDNIQHIAERNRYEKHDFYIKHSPVAYHNDAYMAYIHDFYENMMPRLSKATNEDVYSGILRSSPTLIMHALATEYTMKNLRIRELIMIQSLSEVYNTGDFPQTNIITILDSLEDNCLFKANMIIAKNLKNRITDLVPGGKAAGFVLSGEGKTTKTLSDFKGKHLYIHFTDPNSKTSLKELGLLKELYNNYNKYIEFVTIYKLTDSLSADGVKQIEELGWDVYPLPSSSAIWNNYKIESYPQYTLIDPTSYIVASPALKPTPNGQYETIDLTFFHLKKAWMLAHPEKEELYDRNH